MLWFGCSWRHFRHSDGLDDGLFRSFDLFVLLLVFGKSVCCFVLFDSTLCRDPLECYICPCEQSCQSKGEFIQLLSGPDVTLAVADWALKANYLSIYPGEHEVHRGRP